MFTEYEIETLVENETIMAATKELKKAFIRKEAPYLEIGDDDFFSLVVLAPTVGIALANGSVSLFEEMALNKKARKLSKGGYFLKKDPVVFSMKYLIQKYDEWEEPFFAVIRLAMDHLFNVKSLERDFDPDLKVSLSHYRMAILESPYIFVRFFVSFFLAQDDDIFGPNTMNKTDYECAVDIGNKLGLSKIPIFHYFCNTIVIK